MDSRTPQEAFYSSVPGVCYTPNFYENQFLEVSMNSFIVTTHILSTSILYACDIEPGLLATVLPNFIQLFF